MSDVSLLCQVPAGSGDGKDLIVTVANRVDPVRGTMSRVYTYDAPKAQLSIIVQPVNGATVGGMLVTVLGVNFRSTDRTARVRLGGTACESSVWVSNTAILCKTPTSVGRDVSVAVTIDDRSIGGVMTRIRALSYDAPSIAKASLLAATTISNVPSTGMVSILLIGSGFGVNQYSGKARIGRTAGVAYQWTSDSAVTCKTAPGAGGNSGAAVTVARQYGTLTGVLSYDTLTISALRLGNGPAIGSCVGGSCSGVTVLGSNFGAFDQTLRARVVGTACEATNWMSDSSVVCFVAGGTRVMHNVVVSLALRASTLSLAFSFGETLT